MMRKPLSKASSDVVAGIWNLQGTSASRRLSRLFANRGRSPSASRRTLGWTSWIFCALLLPAWTGATAQASKGSNAQTSAALSAKVVAWANANLASYRQAVDYSKNGPPPQVPVPPLVDPPCRSCDAADTPTPGEAQVATWVKQSESPEAGYMSTLLKVGTYVAQFEGVGQGVLNPAAEKAIKQFSSEECRAAALRLSDRLLNGKAMPMAQKYDSEPKRAYAGITFLMQVGKDAANLQSMGNGSNSGWQAEAIQMAITWEQSIEKTIDSDVVAGHKYNLCPVYGSVYKMLTLLGDQAPNMDSVLAIMQKLQNLLTFDVKMKFDVSSHVKNGTSLDATWSGTAKLKLKLNASGSTTCYSPELENGGQMAMTVDSFQMVSDTDGPVELTSPRSFNIPLGFVQLNLCDPQPILQLPLVSGVIPQETLTAKGQTMQTSLLQTYLSAVVQANHTNRPKINAMTGKNPQAESAPSSDGSAQAPLVPPFEDNSPVPLVPPSSYPSDSNQTQHDPLANALQDEELKQAKAQMTAHRGDAGWIMSAEGQGAIANLQKLAMAKVQAKLAEAGVVVPKSNNPIDLANAVYSTQLPWANGAAQPVNELLKVHKDQLDIYLTITVQQAAQWTGMRQQANRGVFAGGNRAGKPAVCCDAVGWNGDR